MRLLRRRKNDEEQSRKINELGKKEEDKRLRGGAGKPVE
jgi:hypothetical protein